MEYLSDDEHAWIRMYYYITILRDVLGQLAIQTDLSHQTGYPLSKFDSNSFILLFSALNSLNNKHYGVGCRHANSLLAKGERNQGMVPSGTGKPREFSSKCPSLACLVDKSHNQMAGLRLIIALTVLLELLTLCTVSYWYSSASSWRDLRGRCYITNHFSQQDANKAHLDDIMNKMMSQIDLLAWSVDLTLVWTDPNQWLSFEDSLLLQNMTNRLVDSLSFMHGLDDASTDRYVFIGHAAINAAPSIAATDSCDSVTLAGLTHNYDDADDIVPSTAYQGHQIQIFFAAGCSNRSVSDETFAAVEVDSNGNILVRLHHNNDANQVTRIYSFIQGPLARFVYKHFLATSLKKSSPMGPYDWMTDTSKTIFSITVAGDLDRFPFISQTRNTTGLSGRMALFQKTIQENIQPLVKDSVGQLFDTQINLHLIYFQESFDDLSLDWSDHRSFYSALKDTFHVETPTESRMRDTQQWNILYMINPATQNTSSTAGYFRDKKLFVFKEYSNGNKDTLSFDPPDAPAFPMDKERTNQNMISIVRSVVRTILPLELLSEKSFHESFHVDGILYVVNFTLLDVSTGFQRWDVNKIRRIMEKVKLQKLMKDIHTLVSFSTSNTLSRQTIDRIETLSHEISRMNVYTEKNLVNLDMIEKLKENATKIYSFIRDNVSLLPQTHQSFSHYFATIGSFLLPLSVASVISFLREIMAWRRRSRS